MNIILELFNEHGADNYIGEPISQLEHMVQCAMLIEADYPHDHELIVAGLLHDIGHLLPDNPTMGTLGVANHESVGQAFLQKQGFCERVQAIVGQHVNAKRYLTTANPQYFNSLSDASKQTLALQGGPMSLHEMRCFEGCLYYIDALKLRHYDDKAKAQHVALKPLSYYVPFIEKCIIRGH